MEKNNISKIEICVCIYLSSRLVPKRIEGGLFGYIKVKITLVRSE